MLKIHVSKFYTGTDDKYCYFLSSDGLTLKIIHDIKSNVWLAEKI